MTALYKRHLDRSKHLLSYLKKIKRVVQCFAMVNLIPLTFLYLKIICKQISQDSLDISVHTPAPFLEKYIMA